MPKEKILKDSLLLQYIENRRARNASDIVAELDFQAAALAGRLSQLGVSDLSIYEKKNDKRN